jgi:hypothetical protein
VAAIGALALGTAVGAQVVSSLNNGASAAPAASVATNSSTADTQGNAVPIYKAHTFTYDGSGNLSTDTVTDSNSTWVRTYMWSNGAQTSDSGWVRQGG